LNDFLTRVEHEEFARRLDEANARHSKRLSLIEENVQKTTSLVVSVEKLATNMGIMAKELERQGKRLGTLEERDGAMWRSFIGYIITALAGAGIAAIIK